MATAAVRRSRRARDDVRSLSAAGRSRRHRPGRGARIRRGDRPCLRRGDVVDTAARAGLHVARRPLHGAACPRAVADARAPRDALPRRGARPADAARVQPRRGAGGADRCSQRGIPPDDDGDAARRRSSRARCSSSRRPWASRSWPSSSVCGSSRAGSASKPVSRSSSSPPSSTSRSATSPPSSTRAPTASPWRERLLDLVDPVEVARPEGSVAAPSPADCVPAARGGLVRLPHPAGARARPRRPRASTRGDRGSRRSERRRQEHDRLAASAACRADARTSDGRRNRSGRVRRRRLAGADRVGAAAADALSRHGRRQHPARRTGRFRPGCARGRCAAGADLFVAALPDGYDTVVGEGGRPLSAGERQRIALARAFLRDAPLVILDEPTANLDPASAALVADAVERLRAGRTVLLIVHRPELAARADRIVQLRRGPDRRARGGGGMSSDARSACRIAPASPPATSRCRPGSECSPSGSGSG